MLSLSPLQISTVQACVNVFETGSVLGNYAKVTLIKGDSGGLTYGRAQVTLNSGNLGRLLNLYLARPDALYAQLLRPFMPAILDRDAALERDAYFRNLLWTAGDDPVMRECQDEFFMHEFESAKSRAEQLGLITPLGVAIVYDSIIHGSWGRMKRATIDRHGMPDDIGERVWLNHYVQTRRAWLANHSRRDLRPTVYRMDAFLQLMEQGGWDLHLPLIVRGHRVDLAALAAQPPGSYTEPRLGSRRIELARPRQKGMDVRLLQLALSHPSVGLELAADGDFGPTTKKRIEQFQRQAGLPVTGAVGERELRRLPLAHALLEDGPRLAELSDHATSVAA